LRSTESSIVTDPGRLIKPEASFDLLVCTALKKAAK
jgi:hypothetical protein